MLAARTPNDLWQTVLHMSVKDWHELILPVTAFVLTIVAGLVVRNVLHRLLLRWQKRSTGHVAAILIDGFRGPILIWSVIFGIYFALELSSPPRKLEHFLQTVLFALWIISLTVLAVQLAGAVVRYHGRRAGSELPATSLTRTLVQIAVAAIGIAILLRELGISITPLVTALGVGGLAVALALQDTLGNLFGGFYITIAGQIRTGDYIKLSSGEEGYVADINWRSTTLRTLTNNMIILPNSKLSQAIVTNYNLPEREMRVTIAIGVGYSSDLDQVERLLIEIAEQTAKDLPAIMNGAGPNVRLIPGFGDFALQYQLTVSVIDFAQQYLAQHELRKRIVKRFREEKIDMPFPTQTVLLQQQNTGTG